MRQVDRQINIYRESDRQGEREREKKYRKRRRGQVGKKEEREKKYIEGYGEDRQRYRQT